MNAALQAVSNTRPLTLYFQRDSQLAELNCINPVGTKGVVAKRYAELCRELWAGSTRSVAPLKLRWCLSKFAPHLSGGGQHDSQVSSFIFIVFCLIIFSMAQVHRCRDI